MDTISIAKLIDNVLAGTTTSVIAILIIAIIVLINEIRYIRKEKSDLVEAHAKERAEHLSTIDKMQDSFMERSEAMTTKYYESLQANTQNAEKIKDMLAHLITFMTNQR